MTACDRCHCEAETLFDTGDSRLCAHCQARHGDAPLALPEVFVPASGKGEVFHVPSADPDVATQTVCGVAKRSHVEVVAASLPTAIRHGHYRLCGHCHATLDPEGRRTPAGDERGSPPEIGATDLPPGLSPEVSERIDEIRSQREAAHDD